MTCTCIHCTGIFCVFVIICPCVCVLVVVQTTIFIIHSHSNSMSIFIYYYLYIYYKLLYNDSLSCLAAKVYSKQQYLEKVTDQNIVSFAAKQLS